MKHVFGLLFLILVAFLEVSVAPSFLILGAQPCLVLVGLLVLQLLDFSKDAYYTGFFGGILLDLLVGNPFGLSSLVFVLLGGAVALVRRFAKGAPLVILLTTFLASIIFRITQVFPTLEPAALCKGGVLDVGVMLLVYPMLRYVLKGVFGRGEIQVGF